MRFGSYSLEEVDALVEGWQELRESERSFVRVRLMDLERSIPRLSPPLRHAVILHGLLGYTLRASGRMVGVSPTTVLRRHRNGLEKLVTVMNGGR